MNIVAWIFILVLYAFIGAFTAIGSVAITQKFFPDHRERTIYGAFLVIIAMIYLVFMAYFHNPSNPFLEIAGIATVSMMGVIGAFRTKLLMAGYISHGVWDVIHELNQSQILITRLSDGLTDIPLAYGAFCLSFDFCIAGYCYYSRNRWL